MSTTSKNLGTEHIEVKREQFGDAELIREATTSSGSWQFTETIDGSIRNIIQLKTVDNSLEWSQMFDALEDCPKDFQNKLIDALNSIGQDKGIPPIDAFNTVLCKSDEKNEDIRKKLYNWWRGVFEVMSSISDMPKDRIQEYNEKVDALMAEILKAGSEASTEEEPVMESTKPRFKRGDYVVVRNGDDARVLGYYRDRVDKSIWYEVWIMDGNRTTEFPDEDVYASRKEYEAKYLYEEDYERAGKKDEDEMLADMDFATQHLGTIAEKVQELLNFVNPWCKSKVDENFTKEVDMNRIENDNDEWVSMDSLIGVGESDLENELDKGYDGWVEIGQSVGEANLAGTFKVGDRVQDSGSKGRGVVVDVNGSRVKVSWDNGNSTWEQATSKEIELVQESWYPKYGIGEIVSWKDEKDEMQDGWKVIGCDVNTFEYHLEKNGEDVWVDDIRVDEYNESKRVDEASVVVDANDVWDVLDLLDDETANKNLTDLINSHLRTEDEIMDAIESLIFHSQGGNDTITKSGLNSMFSSENIHELVSELGLDVDAFMDRGIIQDAEEPVALESKGGTLKRERLTNGYEDAVEQITSGKLVTFTSSTGHEYKITPQGVEGKFPWKLEEIGEDGKVKGGLSKNCTSWEDSDLKRWSEDLVVYSDAALESNMEQKPDEVKDDPKTFKGDNGQKQELVAGEEKMSDAEAARIMGSASATDMDAADMGLISHDVADPYNKKPVCEMTIEQEVTDPWKLLNLLWGHGRENFKKLLDSNLFSEDRIMNTLEQFEIKNLTSLNDRLTFDFETILDAFGCDVDAWNENLVIQRA